MTGPEHYREAERLLGRAGGDGFEADVASRHHASVLSRAQIHATLSLAAATALPLADAQEWQGVAG